MAEGAWLNVPTGQAKTERNTFDIKTFELEGAEAKHHGELVSVVRAEWLWTVVLKLSRIRYIRRCLDLKRSWKRL